jgi:hypothetical protein
MLARNLIIIEQKVRQAIHFGKIGEPFVRVIFQIYFIALHIQTTKIK